LKGNGTPREVLPAEMLVAEEPEIGRVGELNPRRGLFRESRLWTRAEEGIPEGPGILRVLRPYRERETQHPRYFAA
jgi:hypothetical protein